MAEPSKQPVLIRLATPDDVEGIRQVYAPYVTTPITFEEEAPAAAGFHARMEDIMLFYPCLVACEQEEDTPPAAGADAEPAPQRIVGFAYARRQAERAAYDWNAELSIYLRRDATHRSLGTALYHALLKLLALQGIRCAYARVTLPNTASEHLHARLGFSTMGIQRNAGFKNGAWRDVAWFVKPIGPFDENPQRPAPFPCVAKESESAVRKILESANKGTRP